MKRLLVLLFCVLYAIGGKAHVDCVRDGSEHEAKRSKAYSPPSSRRLQTNIDKKTIELASLTRTRPDTKEKQKKLPTQYPVYLQASLNGMATPYLSDYASNNKEINYIENIKDYVLKVFSLSGEVVFQSTDYKNDFNGISTNYVLPDGDYWYQLKHGSKEYKGNLTLRR